MTPVRIQAKTPDGYRQFRISFDAKNVYIEHEDTDRAGVQRWSDYVTFKRGDGDTLHCTEVIADACAELIAWINVNERLIDGSDNYILKIERQLRSARGRIGALTRRLNHVRGIIGQSLKCECSEDCKLEDSRCRK